MAKLIVSNTGPVISLEKLSNGFDFIRKLYDKIILPEEVLKELAFGKYSVPFDYLNANKIEDLFEVKTVPQISNIEQINRLDEGEKRAISLAHQLNLPLLIEETIGRQVALSAGLQISGIAGQIVKAFREKLIDKTETESKLQELFSGGRINRKIFNSLLETVK